MHMTVMMRHKPCVVGSVMERIGMTSVYIDALIFARGGVKVFYQPKRRKWQKLLRRGESNPGLPRDRREYWPLYYNGYYFTKT